MFGLQLTTPTLSRTPAEPLGDLPTIRAFKEPKDKYKVRFCMDELSRPDYAVAGTINGSRATTMSVTGCKCVII
ncbi:hypothetical protein E2C01_035778 [Portunus trituberculatus]|uniref:Uncharacterized protein n=1 Tax=Portunus trituberculatus TaxID=210409 RepID=A0A5B7FCD6_PORTR|nr:hypothetical protein [Portunus trituberculatus]